MYFTNFTESCLAWAAGTRYNSVAAGHPVCRGKAESIPMALCFAAVVLILAALTVFLVAPGRPRRPLRTPFLHYNFAHRGLFTQDQSIPENSLPAFAAAVACGCGIELDVQFTADRQLVVFHDDTLDRMTGAKGWVRDHTWQQIQGLSLAGTACTPPLFARALEEIGGRVPRIVEIKSRQEYGGAYLDALCTATLQALQTYAGPYCIESFDPRVVRRIRRMAPCVLRGQLADSYRANRRLGVHPVHAFLISHCFGNFLGRPDFIAWCPERENGAVALCRAMGAMMVQWTILPQHDHKACQRRYDALIFQWYSPAPRY